MNLKYILRDIEYKLKWLKVLNSPFKPFKVSLYMGKTRLGIPYFLPRKWVKATNRRATEAALEYIEKEKRYNEFLEKQQKAKEAQAQAQTQEASTNEL